MKVVYIAGKYRSECANGIHDNIEAARKSAIKWWSRGFAVICPHLNTAYFDGACKDSVWLDGDLEILSRCDIMVVLPSWKDSSGTQAEIEFAHNNNIAVVYDDDEW